MKGVIVAAGYGSRFLPLTKTMPKEMLPLFDRPMLDFILDEFEDAGIKDVIIITSRRKKVLDDYLDREVELETVLARENKTALLETIRPRPFNFTFIRQQEMKGTGHALLLTKPYIKDEPFVVAYPDDIVLSSPGVARGMMDLYSRTGCSILAVREEKVNVGRYGVIEPHITTGGLYVKKIVEKPAPEQAPSNLVSIGRYLFTPELLELLEVGYARHTGGEFYHIDSINRLASEGKMAAFTVSGTMLDTGEPATYLESILEYCRSHPVGKKVLDAFVERVYGKK